MEKHHPQHLLSDNGLPGTSAHLGLVGDRGDSRQTRSRQSEDERAGVMNASIW